MKKDYILKKNWEFQEIISKKKQIITKNLILYFVESKQFQIGISTPKKFANAVTRNWIKRQIKAILDNKIQYKLMNFKIVLIVRKDFINLDFLTKADEVIKIFSKLNVLKQK